MFNMNFQWFFFIAILLCINFSEKALAIKCWDCRSDADPKCADPFDNSSLAITDCTQLTPGVHLEGAVSTLCRKIRQKVNGEWRYFRSCGFLGEPGIGGDERFCLKRTGTYNIFVEYCTCNSKDGCNSSQSIIPTAFLILIFIFLNFTIHLCSKSLM